MARRSQRPPQVPPVSLTISRLSHEGRGVAHHPDGKLVFVDFALPGEQVTARLTARNKRYDEAEVVSVEQASPDRVTPPCPHFTVCGGCSLQHMSRPAQIAAKQAVLAEHLQHFGGLTPQHWLPPLVDASESYRRKARLGVRFVVKKDRLLVGFRERQSGWLADLSRCVILDARLGDELMPLAAMIEGLAARSQIAQIEVSAGDPLPDDPQVALNFRHLVPLTDADQAAIVAFCAARGWQCYLQPAGYDSVHRVWPAVGEDRLTYALPDFDLVLRSHPNDFTQVNAGINQTMVRRAVDLLDPQPHERVLDLFCGLGNFTLPLARRAREVVGVEGSEAMAQRGTENAAANGLTNVSFYAHDLTQDARHLPWAQAGFDKVLIDPPRSGAWEVLPHVVSLQPRRIVYVSCNPATLARDAGLLAESGYVLRDAGVMDMFPHTTHVESLAVFERQR